MAAKRHSAPARSPAEGPVAATFATDCGAVTVRLDGPAVNRVVLHGSAPVALTPEPELARLPQPAGRLIEQVTAHLGGQPQSLADWPLADETLTPFQRRVYQALRTVPAGQTITYGALAERSGNPGGARAIASAMAANPFPLLVPCHRVMAADGSLHGFSGGDGLTTKAQLLRAEGIAAVLPRGETLVGSLYRPHLFDLATDSLAAHDRLFARLLAGTGRSRPQRGFPGNPFASLVQAVCYQQLAGSAAAAIFARLRSRLGGDPTPAAVLTAGLEGLQAAGLSRAKAGAALALAQAVAGGEVQLELLERATWDEAVGDLLPLPGIGPWTVAMFAIFHLGLPDLFPADDLGIRKAVGRLLGRAAPPAAAECQKVAQRWRPWRTVATWYLWRSLGTVTL